MSGRGQHFIPQHFQKPFVVSKEKDQIWMYRRGAKKALLLSRADAGKQRDFYSSPSFDELPTLDDLITEYEQTIFPKVDALRALPVGLDVASDVAAEVVVHFSIRSQHLRNSISELWSNLSTGVQKLALDPKALLGSRRLPAHRPPAKIADALREQIISHDLPNLTEVSAETLVRLSYIGVREQLDLLTRDARDSIASSFAELGEKAKGRTREAHQDILRSSLAPPKRVAQMNEFTWGIAAYDGSAAIIPDCVCVALTTAGEWRPFLLAEDVTVVVMPLTPKTLLVGRKSHEQAIDLTVFNSAAANACFEFYLSKEEGLELIVEGQVGQSVRNFIERMTSEKILEAIDDFLATEISAQSLQLSQIESESQVPDDFSFSVRFYDFRNEAALEKVAERLKALLDPALIGNAGYLLDGFTFANEYEDALNDLDRGFSPSGPLKSTKSPMGVGVAMPVTVKRDEVLKTHFVLRGFIASYLTSDDEEEVATANSLLRSLIGGLVLDKLERSRFSRWMLQSIATPLEDALYGHARGVFDTYFKARCSAQSLNDVNGHLDSIVEHLSAMISSSVDQRRSYRVNGDLDAFSSFVFEHTNIILGRIAHVLGGYAGIASKAEVPVALNELMMQFGMTEWLRLFADDLCAFYEGLDGWRDFEEIFFINRHFERWLLFFGLIVEDRVDGLYIHVPLGSDADYLSQLQIDKGPEV
jgi:hypothetical protein